MNKYLSINFAFIDKKELSVLVKLKNDLHIQLGSILTDNYNQRFCIIGMKRREISFLYFIARELDCIKYKSVREIAIESVLTQYKIEGCCNKKVLKNYLLKNDESVVYYREIFNTVRKYEKVTVGTLYMPFNNKISWYELVIENTEEYIKILQLDKVYKNVDDIQKYLDKLLRHPLGKDLNQSRKVLRLNILEYTRMYKKVAQYNENQIQTLLLKMQLLGVNF